MSLLMQALKKAEQAKRSQLAGDDLIKPSEEFDDVLELVPHDEAPPHNRRATDPVAVDLPASELPADFSLEPIEQPPTRDAAVPDLQVPSWNEPQPAADIPDALHTAVPPAASVPPAQGEPTASARRPEPPRHEPGAAHAATGARQRSRTGPPPPSAPPPRAAPAVAMRAPNPKTMRLAALLGALFLIVATFGYLYWRAVYGAGSSKNLPPVPMPGLAGSTALPATPADSSAIVIAPSPAPAYAPPAYEAQAYTPPTDYQPAQAAQPAPPPAYAAPPEAAPQATAATPTTFPSNIGGPPAPTMPAMQPQAVVQATPVQAPPPAQPVPAAVAPGANAPVPTPEQMQGLSPEDYARMDRRVAEAADAAAAAANTTTGGSGVVMTSSAPAPTAATASAVQPPPQMMPPTAIGNAPVQVQQRTLSGEVNPALQSAYAALRQGDIAIARDQYNALLQSEPRNRDVMLGAAAVALRDRQPERAADLYGRLLDANPNDADALAGLVSIRQSDPVQTEARLRRIINLNPEAASALYALGNLYARQGRWSEAQQQYFKAHAVVPQNPDYAFNLAVGLDRINQPRLALTYYQRALALASAGGASFDTRAVSNRIRELGAR